MHYTVGKSFCNMNHTCLKTMRSTNRIIRTTVNTHLEVVWGVHRSNHIWYVCNDQFVKKTRKHGPHVNCQMSNTWLILLKNVATTEGFWRRTSSPVSSIILKMYCSWNSVLKTIDIVNNVKAKLIFRSFLRSLLKYFQKLQSSELPSRQSSPLYLEKIKNESINREFHQILVSKCLYLTKMNSFVDKNQSNISIK